MTSEKQRRNSILITRHYPDLGSDSESVAKCRGSRVVGRGRGSWVVGRGSLVVGVGVGVGNCRG